MIYILNQEQIKTFYKYLNKDTKNSLIRITSEKNDFFPINKNYYNDILEIKFDDKNILPNSKILNKILLFFENNKYVDNFIIHCQAGISRSSSLAVSYCLYKNNMKGIKQIFNNKKYYPNKTIVYFFANLFNYDLKMIDEFYSILHKRLQEK
jgi:predicted protein tyrosine phosphatase